MSQLLELKKADPEGLGIKTFRNRPVYYPSAKAELIISVVKRR